MIEKVLALSAFCILASQSLSLNKFDSSGSEEIKLQHILESLKEFIKFVDNHNLNVSVIGSQNKYSSNGHVKESLAMTMQMPHNDVYLTAATLDDAKQDKYLKKLDSIGNKEHSGASARVIKLENGQDEIVASHSVHPSRVITSPGYDSLTRYKNGITGFNIPLNVTSEILYNYHIKHPSDNVKNVQVVTANVIINQTDISSNFPPNVLAEIKKVLPTLWLSIDDETVLSRVLVGHLDKTFEHNHQAITGITHFALGSDKEYVIFEIGDSNILVFLN